MRSAGSVGDVMRVRDEIATVSVDAPVRRVVEAMAAAAVEGVLVLDERERLGSIADEQLIAQANRCWTKPWCHIRLATGRKPRKDDDLFGMTAGDMMLKRVVPVAPALSAESAIRLLDEEAVNVLPVVDAGRLVGAVFRRDLVRRTPQPLPQARET